MFSASTAVQEGMPISSFELMPILVPIQVATHGYYVPSYPFLREGHFYCDHGLVSSSLFGLEKDTGPRLEK